MPSVTTGVLEVIKKRKLKKKKARKVQDLYLDQIREIVNVVSYQVTKPVGDYSNDKSLVF